MKKIFLSFFMILPFSCVIAQRGLYVPTMDDLNKFLKTKTLVVLEDSPMSDFNFEIKNAMKNDWHITDYDFIKTSEFPKKSQDEKYSFLYSSIVNFEKDKTDSRYIFLCLSLGGQNFKLDDLKDVVSVPLGYFGVDEDSYMYKLEIMVRFMQNHIRLIHDNPDLITSNIFKHYNDNIKGLKDKVLYLIPSELSKEISTPARVKSIYPYKFKFVTPDEVKKAIADRDNDVVFLHKVGPEGHKQRARCYNIIIGAGDANFYYFDYHMITSKNPDGLLESDLKKMAR